MQTTPIVPEKQIWMQAACTQETMTIGLTKLHKPIPPPGGAVIRMTGCGLCGSDLDKLVHHKVPPGTVLGHEVVGVIDALDTACQDNSFHVGDRLMTSHHAACGQCHYCRNGSESMCRHFKESNLNPGGFAPYIALSRDHLRQTAFLVPSSVTDEEASCMEPLACVLRAVRRGGVFSDGTVAVIGLGFIGLMAAQIYRNQGDRVFGVDVRSERLALAQRHGFVDTAFYPDVLDDTSLYALENGFPVQLPAPVDLVFLTVVTAETVRLSLQLVRDGGVLVLFSSVSSSSRSTLPLPVLDPDVLYFREITVTPSYSPARQDLECAARMISDKTLDLKPLFTHRIPLSQLQEAISLYQQGEAIKVLVVPG